MWTICAIRVLNPHQWSWTKQSSFKSLKVIPKKCKKISQNGWCIEPTKTISFKFRIEKFWKVIRSQLSARFHTNYFFKNIINVKVYDAASFSHAQPRVIFIHCLYLVMFNPALHIGDRAQKTERWTDVLEIAGSRPLYATILLPTMFVAWWHTSLQMESHRKNDLSNPIDYTGLRQDSYL